MTPSSFHFWEACANHNLNHSTRTHPTLVQQGIRRRSRPLVTLRAVLSRAVVFKMIERFKMPFTTASTIISSLEIYDRKFDSSPKWVYKVFWINYEANIFLHNDLWMRHSKFRDDIQLLLPKKFQKKSNFFEDIASAIQKRNCILYSVSLLVWKDTLTWWLTVTIAVAILNSAYTPIAPELTKTTLWPWRFKSTTVSTTAESIERRGWWVVSWTIEEVPIGLLSKKVFSINESAHQV